MTPIEMVSFSDCHLGVNRCNSFMMTTSLANLIFPLLDEVEFVILGGDLFDASIGLSEDPTLDILGFIVEFLRRCNEKNITVRVLRGTHSHDRTQLKVIPVLHKNYGFTNDVRYFDKICLEYIERFDMRVLYIPDDVHHNSSEEVLADVKSMMADIGWDYVDYAFMHSYFDFVLPEFATKKPKIVYREDQFDFVRRKITVGHVHNGSVSRSGKVIYNKSTDRICHGEEDPKGCMRLSWDGKVDRLRFVENHSANVFRAWDYSKLGTMDLITKQLEDDIAKLPADLPLFVSITHPATEIRNALRKYMRENHRDIDFTPKDVKTTKFDEIDVTERVSEVQLLTPPTEESLPDVIHEHLISQGSAVMLTRDRISELLKKARQT